MLTGGKEYNQESARAMRFISVLLTPMLGLYALLIVGGIFPSTHYISDPYVVMGIAALWILISVYYFFRDVTSKVDEIFRLVVFHVFALAMFILAMGFDQPFASFYVLLFLASNLYFGRTGLLLSVSSLVVGGFIDILLHYRIHPEVLYQTGFSVLAILFLGFAIIGVVGAQETKRQILLHSRERERLQYDRMLTIMNNLTDAAFSTNDHGKILMYNAAALDLLDTNDNLRGRFVTDLFNLADPQKEKVNLIDILKESTRATRRDDLSHSYADGEAVRLEINFAPLRSSYSLSKKGEEQGGYIIIMRDITKQKSLEEERDEFISVVSHELRTPITIVEGSLSNLDVLMKQPKLPDTKMLASTVSTAHDQVLYLAKMVNDLSTLSRAERGVADTPEEIDVTELLQRLHHQYEKEAETRKLHLNLDLGTKLGKVNVSRLYLEELLQNFITNALKYTKDGSVTIVGKRSKDMVCFMVKDTGIGISRSDQNKVFNKFYRSEDYRIRETNGTGLGLYVSTKLAHKLHTQIKLTSRLNHGSSFSFELPVE